MRLIAVLVSAALLVASCTREEDVTGEAKKCVAELYPAYNPKNRQQCVDVCIKCKRGTTTTCSTSCWMQGAR
jgi:hypothetical protein